MRLSDRDIREELSDGDLTIDSLSDDQIGPGSVDLSFSGEYSYPPSNKDIDVRDFNPKKGAGHADELTIEPEGESGSIVLCTTEEEVSIPTYMDGVVHGRSSIGRLFVHAHTAGYIDPGFSGEIVLELVNHSSNRITIPRGMRICQITFTYLASDASVGYDERESSKYAEQSGAVGSRISKDF